MPIPISLRCSTRDCGLFALAARSTKHREREVWGKSQPPPCLNFFNCLVCRLAICEIDVVMRGPKAGGCYLFFHLSHIEHMNVLRCNLCGLKTLLGRTKGVCGLQPGPSHHRKLLLCPVEIQAFRCACLVKAQEASHAGCIRARLRDIAIP